MNVDVVLLPSQLDAARLTGRSVAVFDVLRATTTITAALAAGVAEIRVFDTLDAARQAKRSCPDALLCGEVNCLRPDGFDLGNSPGDLGPAHRGGTLLMATTNGTRAIHAAGGAAAILVAALVNASAVARRLATIGRDAILLCAGTHGAIAMEDLLGAGAVLAALEPLGGVPETDVARMAVRLFDQSRSHLPGALADTQGGRNVVHAGLAGDVTFAARLDAFGIVGVVTGSPPVVHSS